MRLVRLVVLGSLAICLVACSSPAATQPPASAGGVPSAPVASGPAASAPAASAPAASVAGGGNGLAGDLSSLALTSTAKMCALLSKDEAKAIIGKDIALPPDGMSLSGLGTNCIYETESGMADGTWIKVEIDGVSYKANAGLIGLAGGTATTTTVGGFDATAVESTDTLKEASLVVRLTDPDTAPSILFQAPTIAMAKAVAAIVLPRLATLQ